MEAQAFIERDVQKLIDVGLTFVPRDTLIRRVVEDVRGWHTGDNNRDWERTRALIAERYGYDKFPGNCHVVPNHALVILATLYGQDTFQDQRLQVGSGGIDRNAGNVGCLLEFELDWPPGHGPTSARRSQILYISTADGGGSITDAVIETRNLVAAGYALAGRKAPDANKGAARFSFEFSGSLQGFRCEAGSPAYLHPVELSNNSRTGNRSLAITFSHPHPVASRAWLSDLLR
jgi:hypothetical protein